MEAENQVVMVIDNEKQSMQTTVDLLEKNQFVSGIITASDCNDAILKIISNNPDIILVSYPPGGDTEKQLFELIKTKLPAASLAFIAESREFAKAAIQYGVYQYLLKPLSEKEINDIVTSAIDKKQTDVKTRLNQLINANLNEGRLRFLTTKGYLIFGPDELVFCKSVGYYTELYLCNDRKETSQFSLIKLEEKLEPYGFVRISRTHMINPRYIRRIYKKGSIVTLFFDGVEYDLKSGKVQLRKLSNLDSF